MMSHEDILEACVKKHRVRMLCTNGEVLLVGGRVQAANAAKLDQICQLNVEWLNGDVKWVHVSRLELDGEPTIKEEKPPVVRGKRRLILNGQGPAEEPQSLRQFVEEHLDPTYSSKNGHGYAMGVIIMRLAREIDELKKDRKNVA